jgi:hypothetical protein
MAIANNLALLESGLPSMSFLTPAQGNNGVFQSLMDMMPKPASAGRRRTATAPGMVGQGNTIPPSLQELVSILSPPGQTQGPAAPVGSTVRRPPNKSAPVPEQTSQGAGSRRAYGRITPNEPTDTTAGTVPSFADYWDAVAWNETEGKKYPAGEARRAARRAARQAARQKWRAEGGVGPEDPLADIIADNEEDVPPVTEETDPYQSNPQMDAFAQAVYDILMGGAGMTDYTQALNPIRMDMQETLARGGADLLEQLGNQRQQYGSGSINDLSQYYAKGEQNINSILGQLAYGANESNRQRQLQGALQLGNQLYGSQENAANRELQTLLSLLGAQTSATGQLAGLGGVFQGIDQTNLMNAYNEWLRQEGGYNPELLSFLGLNAPVSQPYYESNAFDNILPIFTALLTSGLLPGGNTGGTNTVAGTTPTGGYSTYTPYGP